MKPYNPNNVRPQLTEPGVYQAYMSGYTYSQSTFANSQGADQISPSYRLREDVNQPGAGAIVFPEWPFTDSETGGWQMDDYTAKTHAFSAGHDWTQHPMTMTDIENWAENMLGLPIEIKVEWNVWTPKSGKNANVEQRNLRVTVVNEAPENLRRLNGQPNVKHNYDAQGNPVVKVTNNAPQANANPFDQTNPFASSNDSVNISDADIPF